MENTTTTTVNNSGEPITTVAEVKNDPFAILETEPIFASDDKSSAAKTDVDLNLTITPQELEAKKQLDETVKAEVQAQLVEEAKGLGLPETSTKEEIEQAKTKIADELKTIAIELGLPETATKEEVEVAKLAKTELEGFVTKSEVEMGLLGAEDGTWKALMLAEGLDVPADYKEENGFDVYKKAETAKWQVEIEKAKTEAQESVFTKLKPDVAVALELANSMPDMTLEQILTPTLNIDSLLKLDKEALIREEIIASNPKYTPEMVDVEMQKIKDNNQIELIDGKIRLDLQTRKENIQNFQQNKIREYQERQIQEKSTAEKAKIDQVIKALDRVPSFLDKNLTGTDRQYLANKITSGAVADLLNNPDKLAKAITMLEFYDKGVQSYENRVREKLLVEHKKQLHNTPITTTTSGANTVVVKKPITNQFDILDVDFGEKK